jgi:hypothetical protein
MPARGVRKLRTIVHKLDALAKASNDMFIHAHLSGIHAELELMLHDLEKSKETATEGPEPETAKQGE